MYLSLRRQVLNFVDKHSNAKIGGLQPFDSAACDDRMASHHTGVVLFLSQDLANDGI